MVRKFSKVFTSFVIPAKAGIQTIKKLLDTGFRQYEGFLNAAFTIMLCITLFFVTPASASDELISKQKLVGKGRFSFLIFDIYDAKLYSQNGVYNANQPFILKLKYLRNINGAEIAKSTIDEIKKQGFKNQAKLSKWHNQILKIFPDISKNETLTGIFTEQKTLVFYNDNKFIAEIKDAEFAKLFFDIWLGEKTSAPHLRKQLLGGV